MHIWIKEILERCAIKVKCFSSISRDSLCGILTIMMIIFTRGNQIKIFENFEWIKWKHSPYLQINTQHFERFLLCNVENLLFFRVVNLICLIPLNNLTLCFNAFLKFLENTTACNLYSCENLWKILDKTTTTASN